MVLNMVHSYIFIYLSFISHDLFTGIAKYYYWKNLQTFRKSIKEHQKYYKKGFYRRLKYTFFREVQ